MSPLPEEKKTARQNEKSSQYSNDYIGAIMQFNVEFTVYRSLFLPAPRDLPRFTRLVAEKVSDDRDVGDDVAGQRQVAGAPVDHQRPGQHDRKREAADDDSDGGEHRVGDPRLFVVARVALGDQRRNGTDQIEQHHKERPPDFVRRKGARQNDHGHSDGAQHGQHNDPEGEKRVVSLVRLLR